MTSFTSGDCERTRAAVAAAVAQFHLPGIAVGVVAGETLVYSEGFGFADIENQQPMRPDHGQCIGSVTKTMVGLCTMALVDEGRLSLDSRITELLPDVVFHGPAESMAIRHLLTHTSGIGEAPTLEALADSVDPHRQASARARDFVATYADGIVVEAAPGTRWAYANHGFALLGEILMRMEKASLHEILSRRIFAPLGMRDSQCHDRSHPQLATGYHRPLPAEMAKLFRRVGRTPPHEEAADGHNIRGEYQWEPESPMMAAGAVQSTIPDMARYATALLSDGAGIVRPATLATMVAPQWCPDARLNSAGLAFARSARRRAFGHGGKTFGGWNTDLTVVPERGLAIIIHMNVFLWDSDRVFTPIVRAVLNEPQAAPPNQPLDSDLRASAPGVYEAPPGKLTSFRVTSSIGRIQISADSRGLVLHSRRGAWKDGARLRPADPTDAAFMLIDKPGDEPAYLLLTRDQRGHVNGLRCDNLVHMVRTATVEPWA